ncbi:hypothetical protein DFR70_107153 [Nocardia tenerifensis]|uniref:Hydroquinone 1,2-dioxygenase large subunit N-terminal domain-containing protein n=1 Tax=Nocardia tenerifensis TaxID=228006 RepID=A0A318JZ14_9NOCA|nr:hypothetical protein [Nocardia tenerifensis]PXX62286.1 hypothetical protein DFR70_107153 [Nocardia tenerifensis]
MTETVSTTTPTSTPNEFGYRRFDLGSFQFTRDEYFARITWPTGSHLMEVGQFLHVLVRTMGQDFFFGWVFFDDVFGTVNHYGKIELFAGTYSPAHRAAGAAHSEYHTAEDMHALFHAIATDWISAGYDPMADSADAGSPFGPKGAPATASLSRGFTPIPKRMLGLAGDVPARSEEAGQHVNRAFADMYLDRPEISPEPGFEGRLHAINAFDHIARSDVSWIPSVVSVTKDSITCMSSEEDRLRITHGNDRPEWFIQLTDEIHWDIADKDTGAPVGRVVMRPGDVAAMPADIRHKGYAPKRAMLLVIETLTPGLPELYAEGKLPAHPVEF